MTGQQRHMWRSRQHHRARRLLGASVIEAGGGQNLGRVTDEVFDAERQQLLGFLIHAEGEGDGRREYLAAADVQELSPIAVTVGSPEAVRSEPPDDRARQIISSGARLGGAVVFNDRGDTLGRISDALVHPHGEIVAYEVRSGPLGLFGTRSIDAARVISAGKDTLIVRDDDIPVDAGAADSGQVEFLSDGSVSVPLMEDELVVYKRRIVSERLLIRDGVVQKRRHVGAELWRVRVSVPTEEGDGVEADDDHP